MLLHYLHIALRAVTRHKLYTLINVVGLTVGITSALIISMYVYDELSYDHNEENLERIYRLDGAYHLPNNAGFEQYALCGPVIGEVIGKEFPEIESVVRLHTLEDKLVQGPDEQLKYYERITVVDSSFFKVFTAPLLAGNADEALRDINTVVITAKTAMKYFGKVDVLGRTLRLPNDSVDLKVSGVMADYPSNTEFKLDMMISMETFRITGHAFMQSWWSYGYHTYLLLRPHTDFRQLEEKLRFISRRYIPDEEDGSGYHQEYALTPLARVHLYSHLRSELEPNAKASYVYMFLLIGVFILCIACINFMNLATARSAMRAKEIGLRKVAGAYRFQLITQFLSEALALTAFAGLAAVLLTYLLLPYVNDVAGKALHFTTGPALWISIAGIILFVALLAGGYPAFFLAAFRPVDTLKGRFKYSARGSRLRKGLVVFQFAISIFLIAGTLIITAHLNFIRSLDLGFTRERVLFIPNRGAHSPDTWKVVKQELEQLSGVEGATISSSVPGHEMDNNVVRLGWNDDAAWNDMRYITVDYDFMNAYGVQLLLGRSFSRDYPSDENQAFLVNESGARRLGFKTPEEAIGQKIGWQRRKGYIIGVLKDFHYMSANVAIEPFLVVMNTPHSADYLSIKVNTADLKATLNQIRSTYAEILPGDIFEYHFLDEDFDRQYKSEDRFMTVFSAFATVAIVVAALGLYGLAMFMGEQRTREVGVRKVLGATVENILVLLTTEFVKLVVISFVVAVPLAYWVINRWLQSFPYHEQINLWLFVVAGVAAVVIAMLTVSYQAIKSARANPVNALSSE